MGEVDDTKLSSCLQKLDLEGPKRPKIDSQINPFQRKRSKSLSSINVCCSTCPNGVKKTTSFKSYSKKILVLREPVLKIIKFQNRIKSKTQVVAATNDKSVTVLEETKSADAVVTRPTSTCSHQARMNVINNPAPPCDVTIDELASYFETSVHIPKKMSSMAEMMYI